MNTAHQQGSALMVVVVLMLVLSVVGMSMVYLMEGERNTTVDEMHVRGALYAAELGLRRAERILLTVGSGEADNLLQHVSSETTAVLSPPIPVFPQQLSEFDLGHLGTYLLDGATEVANQEVVLPSDAAVSGAGATKARFSLFLRNNSSDVAVADGDPSTDARGDNDFTVNLVSVGWVELGGNAMAVKILEEEYTWAGVSQEPSVQKLSDSGGTSSAQFGG